MAFDPTPEQLEAESHATARRTLVVEAGAGTGKTSTLVHVAHGLERMGLVGAYFCFNSTTADEARQRFPRNVTAGTAHSFATRASRGYWHHRLRTKENPRPYQNAKTVAKILSIHGPHTIPGVRTFSATELATLALRTVRRFCGTTDQDIAAHHVPQPKFFDDDHYAALAQAVLPFARHAWEDLRLQNGHADKEDACLNYEHDFYLKRWQLGVCNPELPDEKRPRILVKGLHGGWEPAKFIMFDEAQDADPVMAAIIRAHYEHYDTQLILVGDRNQAIYGFRNCIDIMGDFPDAARTKLTKSFRFGPAIAREANKFLALLESDLRIQGHEPVESHVGPLLGPVEMPDAVLCRSNAGAMRAVLTQHAYGRKVHLVGDGDEISRLAKAAIELQEKKWTPHPDLRDFKSWRQVVEYVERGELGTEDLQTSVKLIEEFSPETVLAAIEQLVPEGDADVVVCTAHKAKGLEWDNVEIGDDFRPPNEDEDSDGYGPDKDESMLAYVALTRARRRLALGSLDWADRWLELLGLAGTVDEAPALEEEPEEVAAAGDVLAHVLAGNPLDIPTDVLNEAARTGERLPMPEPVELRPLPSEPLARAVEMLRRHEVATVDREVTETPWDDVDRARFVRDIVAAYLGKDAREVLAEKAS